jgi:cytochrome c5
MNMRNAHTLAAVAVALAGVVGCNTQPAGVGVKASAVGSQYDRFAAFDASGADAYGIKGFLPPNGELANQYYGLTENQRLGLATWHLFAAERGDFFRVSQKVTWNGQNMFRTIDARGRADLFERTGLINDPDCTAPTAPDQFGFYIANCPRDPYSTGIVGLRLRPNPDFNLDAWKALGDGDVNKAAAKWLQAPKDRFEWKSDANAAKVAVEPPYEIAMSCTICHAAPNPLNPPADVNKSTWKNIVFALGNQFFKEGQVFGDGIPTDDFLSQVLGSQHPGTSDTSRMATDHIHNPNVINAIFNLPYRPLHKERVKEFDAQGRAIDNYDIKKDTCDGDTCEVDTFRVLKDGADSSGVSGAALRVFINIGSCFSQFSAHMDPIFGKAFPESPLSRLELGQKCPDYAHLTKNAPALVDYLRFVKPYHLKDAPGGAALVKPWDDSQIKLGRQVFAEECATCHSSKQPESPTGEPTRADSVWEQQVFANWTKDQQQAWLHDPQRVAWFKQQVEDPTFFAQNYLSDDRRYPVSLIGTNSARALGTNAGPTGVWAEYASVDYQTLQPADIPLYSFKWGNVELDGTVKGPVGRGYYRTPSLWGIWFTAPFLNNNGLGNAGGVSTDERLASFQDSIEKLLGLRDRGVVITKTTRFTALTTIPFQITLPFQIPGFDPNKLKLGLPIPPGIPVSGVANLEMGIRDVGTLTLADALRLVVDPQFFMDKLKDFITVFDPIENKGHEFGYNRTVEERQALIEFLKSLT